MQSESEFYREDILSQPLVISAFKDRFILIDGLNRMRLQVRHKPNLAIHLSVVLEIAKHSKDFICFFDANTRLVLGVSQGTWEATACQELPFQLDDFFVECAGGTIADDLILPKPQERSAVFFLNDRCRNQVSNYPWMHLPVRLFRINRIRHWCWIGTQHVAPRIDLNGLLSDLYKVLQHQHLARKSA